MSTLGFYPDAPNKIRYDGIEISIKFEKTGPTTARISWTLPNGGVEYNLGDLSYNGIVIVIDNVAINQQRTVTDGVYYTADPTVDVNLFAGDKIDTALVVGAFYNDITTTYIDITGIKDKTPYYVAGFAVDNTCHYHKEGVHSYSQQYGSSGTEDTAGYQLVTFGVAGTDLTGLDPASTYYFRMTVDGLLQTDYNTGNINVTVPGTTYDISVLGSNATTFNDLINNLNYQLAVLNNPYQGSSPPGTNGYYFDIPNQKLYQWTGATSVLLDPIFSATTPTAPVVGDYWFEHDTLQLYQWNGAMWVDIPGIHYNKAPNQLTCDDFWFDGATAWVWNSTIWTPLVTYKQESDPSGSPLLPCNSYWFDETNHTLSYWKDYLGTCNVGAVTDGYWVNASAILWPTNPRLANIGQYWFNETNNTINNWNGTNWTTLTTGFAVTVVAPGYPATGFVWYNPTAEELKVWNGTTWVITDILVWTKDPMVPLVGELWWNTTTDQLFTWDQLTSAWKQVVNFTISTTNPAVPTTINVNDIWYVPSTKKMFRWDGSQWCDTAYIDWLTDPTIVVAGNYYYNSVEDKWYTYDGTVWAPISYIKYNTNPSNPQLGDLWIKTPDNTLWQWNGLGWIPVMYSATPISPPIGTLWYDTINHRLNTWNGQWVIQVPSAFVVMDNGNIAFFSGSKGSLSTIHLIDGNYVVPPYPLGLFSSLTPTGKIQIPVNGADGVSDYPTWSIEGIGTDGSSDERRDMAENILLELGYPTIQVELTKEQLDFCIDQALQVLRRSSSSPYERVYFFLDLYPQQQHYILSDKHVGFNKIVSVMGLHRMSSAFLGTAEGQGVYGQIVLQHLYQMGTFDLVSYHIINEYVELMEKLFAANLMYKWDERHRRLSIQQNLWRKERILVDATIERTEQDIMSDRMLNNWIQTWATAEARMILAEIRGKYQSLPGAGGGIALNASDLRLQANTDFEKCWQELDDFIATDVEEYGLGGAGIIMG